MRIRTPGGAEVPFRQVARVEAGRGFSSISRIDRRRVVNVTADIDQKTTNAGEVLADLQDGALLEIQAEFPGLFLSFEGQERDRMESMESLKKGSSSPCWPSTPCWRCFSAPMPSR